ncbi:MAG: transposase, partial [Gammaproteobacteria bacterium]|nr:transposase [Gammaproteobacteria bacterium]
MYDDFYFARGEAENRIKECRFDLIAARLSTETFRGNQLRLWWASTAWGCQEFCVRGGFHIWIPVNRSPYMMA